MSSAKQTPIASFVSKLGTARKVERSRIWIEGGRLAAAGFTPGRYFVKERGYVPIQEGQRHAFRAPMLTLHLLSDEAIVSAMPCKVSGKGDKPIIDITGSAVLEAFGATCERVKVTYYAGRIEIVGAA